MRGSVLILASTLLLAACAGPRAARDRNGAQELPPVETINHAAYEDFDPSAYEEEPVPGAEVVHDVPAGLMDNRPEAGATRTAQGFRVQISQTQSKAAADALVGEASVWWREQAARTGAPAYFTAIDATPVYVAYLQPYYRVRLGNFATQAEAQRAAAQIARRFPGAAVVPDTVTLPQ